MFVVTFVVLAMAMGGLNFGHVNPEIASLSTGINLSTNAIVDNLSINVSRIAWIDQPTQAMYSVSNPQVQPYVHGNVTTSPYLTIYNKTVGSTVYDSRNVFNLSKSVSAKGNVQFLFVSERLAYNGSGVSNYMLLSAGNNSTVPTTGNFAYFEFGSSGASFVFSNNSTIHSTYNLPANTILPLQFYTVEIQVTTTATEFNVSQNGVSVYTKIVTAKTNLTKYVSTLNNGTTDKLYLENFMTPTASTTGDSYMMDYFYFLDKYTYQASSFVTPASKSSILSQAIGNTFTNVVNFDPSVSHTNLSAVPSANLTAPVNSNGVGAYASANKSNSNVSLLAGSVNLTNNVNKTTLNQTHTFLENGVQVTINRTASANQTVGALQQQGDPVVSGLTTASVATWNTSQVGNQLQQSLINYVSSKTGIATNQIQIVSYLISSVSVDTNVSKSVVSNIDNTFYNTVPALMQANNISLVNMSTGAIVAGYDAGQFYQGSSGLILPMNYAHGQIVNPFTDVAYATPQSAGFAKGASVITYTSITGDIVHTVYVSQLSIAGWLNGEPLFKNIGKFAMWGGLFGGLTSAGSAVSSFFSSAQSSVGNAVKAVTTHAPNLQAIVNVIPHTFPPATEFSNFMKQASTTVHDIIPNVGGVATNVINSIGSLKTSAVKTVQSATTGITKLPTSIGSVASEFGGSIMTGATAIKTKAYDLGGSVVNTADKVVNTSKAVLNPVFVSVKSLPAYIQNKTTAATTSVANFVHGAQNKTMAVLNKVGTTFSNVSGTITEHLSAFGNMTKGIVNSVGGIGSALSNAFGWVINIAKIFGHYLIYVIAIVGGVIALILGIIIYKRVKGVKKLVSKSKGRGVFKKS